MKCILPALGLLLAGCATSTQVSGSRESAFYSTMYLSADGRVVADPRAGTNTARPQRKLPAPGYWNGGDVAGSPSITIDLGAQEAYFYKGGKLVGMAPVSTGREGFNTPTGSFRVIQKNPDHLSNLYGNYVNSDGQVVVANVSVQRDKRPPGTRFQGAEMPYFMRVTGAVGLHGGYLPGYPASHGCIRLPMDMAGVFYENAPHGTPVRIVH